MQIFYCTVIATPITHLTHPPLSLAALTPVPLCMDCITMHILSLNRISPACYVKNFAKLNILAKFGLDLAKLCKKPKFCLEKTPFLPT